MGEHIAEPLQPLAVDIDLLQLLPGNPRKGDVDAVAASYERFGQRKPIVANHDGTVIAGNHQLMAARKLGWKQIAVVYVDDDEPTAKAFALADNRVGDLGGYDNELLSSLLAEVAASPEGLLGVGYTEQDMDELLAQTAPPLAIPEETEIPTTAPAKTIKGDIWLLGPHRLMCGDSSVETDIERMMAGKKADALLTDPPYGINLNTEWSAHGGRDYTPVANDDVPFDASFLRMIFHDAIEQFWWGANYYHRTLCESDLHGSWLVWDKRTPETDVVVGSGFELCWSANKHKQDVLRYHWTNYTSHINDGHNRAHPTEKPIAMLIEIISRWIPDKSLIIDPFAGSGTTLIASHQTGRTCYTMELDPHYCDIICARFQKLTGIEPIAEATGNPHNFL